MTPEHTMDLAKFMHRVGMIKNEPSSWKDMFFEDIHDLPGS
jgi:NitT/TauT family transport system substrate-binding protein